jgi:hypothetical protein
MMRIDGSRGPYTPLWQDLPKGDLLAYGANALWMKNQLLSLPHVSPLDVQTQLAPTRDPNNTDAFVSLIGAAHCYVASIARDKDEVSFTQAELSNALQAHAHSDPRTMHQAYRVANEKNPFLPQDDAAKSLFLAKEKLAFIQREQSDTPPSQEFFELMDFDQDNQVSPEDCARWLRYQDGFAEFYFKALADDEAPREIKEKLTGIAKALIRETHNPNHAPFQLDNTITGGEEAASSKILLYLTRENALQPAEKVTLRRVLHRAVALADSDNRIMETSHRLARDEEF